MSELLDTARWLSRQLTANQNSIKALSAPQLATSSIEAGTVEEYDADGTLVSAVGAQFDGTHAAVTLAGPPPPEPVPPTVTAGVNSAEVRWNGKFVDDALSPMDFSHVAVHASQLESFTPDNTTQRATITGESGDTATLALDAGEWYFLLVAVSKAGKWSDPSDAVLAEVADAQQDVVTDALSGFDGSLTAVQMSVNGKNTFFDSTVDAAPSVPGITVSDHWRKWTTLAAGGKLLASWRWDGTTWLAESMDPTYLPLVDIGAGTFNNLTGDRLSATAIDGKIITGATFQTTATANRGLKWDATGLKMWDPTGVQTLSADASTGYVTVTGRLRTGPNGSPGVVLIPPVESSDGKTMALWFTPDTASLPGGVTAGVWISNPVTSATPGAVNVRGQQYGGVTLWDAVEFASNNATIPQAFSNHGSGFQLTAYNGTLYLTSGVGETRIKSALNTSINVGAGKFINFQQNSSPYVSTNGASANMILFTDGNIFKTSSALKYKIDPRVMTLDDRLLDDVTVKSWIDVGMATRYAESFDFDGVRDEQAQREYDALSLERIPGAIAEDVLAAGGERFVTRDAEGELDGLMYDRFALARTEILKRRVEEQAAEIAELRAMFEELKASLTA